MFKDLYFLRRKEALGLLGVFLGVFSCITLVFFVSESERERANINKATLAVHYVNGYLSSRLDLLKTKANFLKEVYSSRGLDYVFNIEYSNVLEQGFVNELGFLIDGKYRYVNQSDRSSYNFNMRDFIEKNSNFKLGDVYFSHAYKSKTTSVYSILAFVENNDGSYLSLEVPVTSLIPNIVGDDEYVYLLSSNDYKFIYHPDNLMLGESVFETTSLSINSLENFEYGVVNYTFNGIRKNGYYLKSDLVDWHIVFCQIDVTSKNKTIYIFSLSMMCVLSFLLLVFVFLPRVKISNYDSLTGLLSRNSFEPDKYGSAFAYCLIDIDYFKLFNDKFGHAKGDEILKETAKRLSCSLYSGDLLYRWGGEEFLLIINNRAHKKTLNEDNVKEIICRVTKPFMLDIGCELSFSAGFTLVEGKKPMQCINEADIALYTAKSQGRNRVIQFLPGISNALNSELPSINTTIA